MRVRLSSVERMRRASARIDVDGFAILRIERGGLLKQRSVAQDHGERIVQLLGDVAGQLAEAGELLRVDQLLKHHGLAARGLQAGGQAFRWAADRRRASEF